MERAATISGGGPVGCVLAVLLARRGWRVRVLERRPDPRRAAIPAGRSINLVLTERGLRGLAPIGLREEVLSITTPVFGRMMHDKQGRLAYQPYGKDDSERNHSVSRAELQRFLLDRAEQAGARVEFDAGLVGADLARGQLTVESHAGERRTLEARHVFGCDGAPSGLRAALTAAGLVQDQLQPLPWGYKELTFPAGADGAWAMDGRALHIWPRGAHMLMGLPNRDGTFTGTVYLPWEGARGSFAALTTPGAVLDLFRAEYPDAVPLLGGEALAQAFLDNPTGHLDTVRCVPWHHQDRALLLGDAAHAVVPFFGQGLNCGFEDCAVLDELLAGDANDLGAVFAAFSARRKPNADAIADMALENFVEMRDKVGDPAFLLRKQVESRLERELPQLYRSRYAMVVYSSIPYAVARELGRVQDELLGELCRGVDDAQAVDLGRARSLIEERLTPVRQRHGVDLARAFA